MVKDRSTIQVTIPLVELIEVDLYQGQTHLSLLMLETQLTLLLMVLVIHFI